MKNVKSALNLFRICIVFFLILSFMAFSEGDTVVRGFGLMLTSMMTVAFIGAELSHYADKKSK